MENENVNLPENTDDIQVPAVPKKKKALKIVLVLLALFVVLLIVGGAVVVKMLGNLGNIKPTDGGNTGATEAAAAVTDEPASAGENEETTNESVTQAVSAEESTAAGGEEPAATEKAEENVSGNEAPATTGAKEEEKTSAKAPENTFAPTTQAHEEKTTASSHEETTAAPAKSKNEYDIYRSGSFYAVGSITDAEGTAPMELAVTDDTLYMNSNFEGVDIGLLVVGDDSYMIYPGKKAYMEINSMLKKMMGGDADELFNADDMGFSRMGALDKALSVSDAALNGVSCKRYLLPDEDDFYYVYMNGDKLLRIEALDKNKKVESTIDFTSVSEDVPADKKAPSKEYKKTGMIEFFKLLSEVMV